jgi:hypothetical protein
MKNYKIAGGKIVNREDGTTVESLTGKLTAVGVTESENGTKYLNIVLTDGDEKKSLRVKLYGDASMKIIRCLYGVASTLTDGIISITMEERENSRNLICLAKDGCSLVAVGSVPPYEDLRTAFIQRLLNTVRASVECEFPVAVLTIEGVNFDDPTLEEIEVAVRGARPNGHAVCFTKKVFTTPVASSAFLEGARAVGAPNAFITDDPDAIEVIRVAIAESEPVPETTEEVVPEDNEEC